MVRSKKVQTFDYSLDYKTLDFRKNPELYRIGRGEQGVLLVQPYKDEILPHWKFKTAQDAKKSGKTIYALFLKYLEKGDFVGADMARKFLQMGYTRSRRYYWHASGKKFGQNPQRVRKKGEKKSSLTAGPEEKRERIKQLLPDDLDPEKNLSAQIFKKYWQKAAKDPSYLALKEEHKMKI